jgi:choice-of-anchor C domain-containing protein
MLTMFKKAAIGAALFTGLASTSAHAVSLINGGFEDPLITVPIYSVPSVGPLTGWSVFVGNIEIIKDTYWQASEGSQSLDLNGVLPGGISQTVTGLVAGGQYMVSFDMSSNPIGGSSVKTMSVTAGGASQTFTYDRVANGTTFTDMKWVTRSLMFTAGGTSELLSFADLSGGAASGAALDNVRIKAVSAPVPVPAAGLLGLSGALLLGALRMSRRRESA